VAPAAISALVATMVLTDHGTPRIPGLPETCALAATFVVVRRTGNVAAGMLCGFPVL
jgi:branched-subunit amino acid transport protein